MLSQNFDLQGILSAAPDLKTGTEQAVEQWHNVYIPAVMANDIQPLLDQMKAAKQSYFTAAKELDNRLHEVASQIGMLEGLARRFGVAEGPSPIIIRDESAFINANELNRVNRHR